MEWARSCLVGSKECSIPFLHGNQTWFPTNYLKFTHTNLTWALINKISFWMHITFGFFLHHVGSIIRLRTASNDSRSTLYSIWGCFIPVTYSVAYYSYLIKLQYCPFLRFWPCEGWKLWMSQYIAAILNFFLVTVRWRTCPFCAKLFSFYSIGIMDSVGIHNLFSFPIFHACCNLFAIFIVIWETQNLSWK